MSFQPLSHKGLEQIGDTYQKVVIRDGSGHYLELPSLTTTQRDALTPSEGMMVYNSTTDAANVYANGAWTAILTDAATATSGYYLVAASDAPDDVKALAHIVCDGTDDNLDFETALATSKPIKLSEGNFYFSAQVGRFGVAGTWSDNTFISGMGNRTIIQPIAQVATTLSENILAGVTQLPVVSSTGFTAGQNITVDVAYGSASVGEILEISSVATGVINLVSATTLSHNSGEIVCSSFNCFDIYDADYVTIKDLSFDCNGTNWATQPALMCEQFWAILIKDSSYATIDNIKVINSRPTGAGFVEKSIIVENVFDSTISKILCDGIIDHSDGARVTITQCHVINGGCIYTEYLQSPAGDGGDILIGNTVIGGGYIGISGQNCIVADNTVDAPSATDAIIIGNGNSNLVIGNTIKRVTNNVDSNGIRCTNSSYNTIIGNTLHTATTTTAMSITTAGTSDYNTIIGNKVSGTWAASTFTGTSNKIHSNDGITGDQDVDDTPVDGATTAPVSSNWAYDHVAAADPHTVYPLDSEVLKKDGSVALTADWLIGEQAIQLDSAISADGKYSGIVEAGTAGATLAFGDLVYLQTADSRWELASADNAATGCNFKLGICILAAAGDGSATTILLWGKVNAATAFPALTVGAPVFMGTTAGDVQVAAPTGTTDIVRIVGYGNTGDELFFCPENDWLELV